MKNIVGKNKLIKMIANHQTLDAMYIHGGIYM